MNDVVLPNVARMLKLFRENVKVLAVPAQTGPSGGSNLILRVNVKDAADFAYAAGITFGI